MKINSLAIALLALMLIYSSCEDPIIVQLAEAAPIITVDAWIDDRPILQEIILSYSQPYFDSTLVAGIDEAMVEVISSAGNTMTFTNNGNGKYTYDAGTEGIIGNINDTFELNVTIGDDKLSATSRLNPVPSIDSITQEFRTNEAFLDDGIYCNFFSRDILGIGNTYWIKTFKNGLYLNNPQEINLAFDAGFDSGSEVDNLIFITPIRELANEIDTDFTTIPWEVGEDIRVEIHSISNASFNFMETLRDQLLNSSNGIFAEPLSNTPTNIVSETGAVIIGQFNVASVSTLSDTIR